MNIPIVVVAYNRVNSLRRLLTSISRAEYPAEPVELIISIDKGENEDVIRFAREFPWPHGPKTLRCQPENLGLKRHILSCGDLSQEYDGIIMLEDDLYVSRDFYRYALEAAAFVRGNDRIGGVALYNHRLSQLTEKVFEPVCDGYDNWYFQYAASWGQMWTREQWAGFKSWYLQNTDYDFDNSEKIPDHIRQWGKHSWLKYNIAYLIETDRFFLYPRVARSTNFCDAGVNEGTQDNQFQVPLLLGGRTGPCRFSALEESRAVYDAFMENRWLTGELKDGDVCVDLYGAKTYFEGKTCLLTSARLEGAELLETYGRVLRPHEMNVIEKIPGEELRLYRLREGAKKMPADRAAKKNDVRYFVRGISYPYKKVILTLFWEESVEKVRRRLKKLFR